MDQVSFRLARYGSRSTYGPNSMYAYDFDTLVSAGSYEIYLKGTDRCSPTGATSSISIPIIVVCTGFVSPCTRNGRVDFTIDFSAG